ncbi:hypothetical protein AVEN_168716-1 [Araneus ventricosus]|uniref:Uncharacterized protein n=1 Tax=Araneus ventricosus TaxID=182803 RepID=A0A4Y2WSV8_ARAVE|nr:hypothetical protein AVEN_168716-1 [Araneus ventricosus]
MHRLCGMLHAKSYVVAKCPHVAVAWKFGEDVPAQVSSSSSDCGSKLQRRPQKDPRVASKRDINITKFMIAVKLFVLELFTANNQLFSK